MWRGVASSCYQIDVILLPNGVNVTIKRAALANGLQVEGGQVHGRPDDFAGTRAEHIAQRLHSSSRGPSKHVPLVELIRKTFFRNGATISRLSVGSVMEFFMSRFDCDLQPLESHHATFLHELGLAFDRQAEEHHRF